MASPNQRFGSGRMPMQGHPFLQQKGLREHHRTQLLPREESNTVDQDLSDYRYTSLDHYQQSTNDLCMNQQGPRYVPNLDQPTADFPELYDFLAQYSHHNQDPFNPFRSNEHAGASVNLTQAVRDKAHTDALLSDSGYNSRLDVLSMKSAPVTSQTQSWETQEPVKRVRRSQDLLSPPMASRRTQRSSTTAGFLGTCTMCRQFKHLIREFKTESDKRKHMLTHTKPFRCTMADCEQIPSCFATVNDLSRHQKSVHGITSTLRSEYYKCRIPDCPKAEKLHDRRDNFKNHIDRTHIKNGRTNHKILFKDLDYWIRQSIYQPTDTELATHYAGKLRKPRQTASDVGTTIDASSIGQSHESESFIAPSQDQQSTQWMADHGTFEEFSFPSQPDSQQSQYPSFEASSFLQVTPTISVHPSPALDPINQALNADLSDLNMMLDPCLSFDQEPHQTMSSSLPNGFCQNPLGLGLGNVTGTAGMPNAGSMYDADPVFGQDLFSQGWNFDEFGDDSLNVMQEEEQVQPFDNLEMRE